MQLLHQAVAVVHLPDDVGLSVVLLPLLSPDVLETRQYLDVEIIQFRRNVVDLLLQL